MRLIIAAASALTLLAACTQETGEDADATAEIAAEGPVQATSAVTFDEHIGTWNVTYADGSTAVTTNREDGSFTTELGSGEVIEGLWALSDDGTTCWDSGGEEGATCYTVSPAAEDGSRTLTLEDGTEVTVTPAE
ncbi:hypothetical protein [Alteraurantiacibacter aquimixticola]|uniref:Lipocalin-like domain-containing protein n=1 Tax=Alteraurantiacibacter aquimixticola TaxID=2489173 RepID=A0A4T3F4G1_9SPHN|nr:hypothetical protein [Alteraurantiacibacter aquimixticola]TIX49593.1 hypothetical protein E5222_12205 [Alteraurantiacibacter aquimixticola]